MRTKVVLVAVFTAWCLSLACWAQAVEPERCVQCGMDMSKYPHTRYLVRTTDDKTHVTCGVQCGLTVHLRLGEKWRSATATDLLSNRPFDVKEGFFVYGSSVKTDMAPGFIAFKVKANAEKFATGFGGRVITYDEALDTWKKHRK